MRWHRLAAGLFVVVALGACAQTEDTTTPETSPEATTTAAATAGAGAAVRTESNMKFGTILVDAQGRSLYTFDKDTGGTIACTDACASTWPPVISAGTPSGVPGLGVAKRPDGTSQVTYNGKPLYRYSGDAKAGDTNGDGVGGVWHIAKVS
jgi:predicted lipoprotein with Yx(FWY)xxD motif